MCHSTQTKMNELLDLHRRFQRYCSVEEGLATRTVQGMESSFKTFVKRTGISTLAEVSKEVILAFFCEGKEVYHWSYSHHVNNQKYLKKFLNWCVGNGHRKDNPIDGMKRPKAPKALPRRLSEEDAKKVLYASFEFPWRYYFEGVRNHAMIETLLYTGLRANELLNLKITDVDLREKTLLVRHGKGDKDRYIPIHFQLVRTLDRYLVERKRSGRKSEWFFTGIHSDKPLLSKDLSRICKKLDGHSGVRFTPHQLRHTFASRCIEEGLNVVELKEVLGHSSLASTMIYLKISPGKLRESLNKLELF